MQRQLNHVFAKQIDTYFTPQYMNPDSPFNVAVRQAEQVANQRNEPPNYIDVKRILREQLRDLKTLSREILTANNPALMELQRIDKRTSDLEEQAIDYREGKGTFIDRKDAIARAARRSTAADLTTPEEEVERNIYVPFTQEDEDFLNEMNKKYSIE